MALPEKIYYVAKTPGGKPLGWWNPRGSGLFTRKFSALGRYADLGRNNIDSELYVGEVTWRKVRPVK